MCSADIRQSGRRTRASLLLLVVACFMPVAGCGGGTADIPTVYPVRGRVLVGGVPPKGAMLVMHPEGTTRLMHIIRPQATVGEDGTFEISTYLAKDGAEPGKYHMTLYWPGPVPPGSEDNEDENGAPPDRLGGKYLDPATTPFVFTIERQPNDLGLIEVP